MENVLKHVTESIEAVQNMLSDSEENSESD